MTGPDLPDFDVVGVKEYFSPHSQGEGTQTIDLSNLFDGDVYTSGTFDLGAISSSTFGRLLDALPIPALLIDRFYQVGFANQSCAKISSGYRKIRGIPFVDLVPLPNDADRAQALSEKIQELIQTAFETRKPRVAEAILEIENKRIWARLHLRSVRIGLERYVLLTIEDLTHEKKQLVLSQRHDEKFRKANYELGKCMDELTGEVGRLQEQLSLEVAEHVNTQETLRRQKQEFEALWAWVPVGLVFIGNAGSVERVNPKFSEMFGYEVTELSNNPDWLVGLGQSGTNPGFYALSDWVDALGMAEDQTPTTRSLEVRRNDGHGESVNLTAIRATNEKLLLILGTTGEC
ncbi:MAG: PAS domain-containing protein [Desulfomonilaceae bacterium]